MDAHLLALDIAAPAIQLVDLAREPAVRASVEGIMKNAGTRLNRNAIRSQLPAVIGEIKGERIKLLMGKTDIRDPLMDAWAIAAMCRHFGPDFWHERACTLSWILLAAHSWTGMANLLECVGSTLSGLFLGPAANFVSGWTDIIGPAIEILNRVAVHISSKVELGAYKLAKLANEQFENLCFGKLPSLYGAIEKLKKVQGTLRSIR